jgi:1-deoxy-D-xylulose 5-phosphate reductoisomerase
MLEDSGLARLVFTAGTASALANLAAGGNPLLLANKESLVIL